MAYDFDRTKALRSLQSSPLLERAQALPLPAFLDRPDAKHILLVRLDPRDAELSSALTQRYGVATGEGGAVPVLDFHTAMADLDDYDRTQNAPRDDVSNYDLARVGRWVAKGACFPVPLAKQSGAFSDRIAVGRAVNKDIALRTRSVSKFHAWFELDESGQLCLADAGSKNGTALNGKTLQAKAPTAVSWGDDIRLGKVEVTVCSGEQFWQLASGI